MILVLFIESQALEEPRFGLTLRQRSFGRSHLDDLGSAQRRRFAEFVSGGMAVNPSTLKSLQKRHGPVPCAVMMFI